MERTIAYVEARLDGPIELADAARDAGYSVWHFCERFKRCMGITFAEYVRERRMRSAVSDLRRGASVTDVAFRYGYGSISGFERAFLKTYGTTPSIFARENDWKRGGKHMLALTDRCAILREELVHHQKLDEALIGQYRYWYDRACLTLPMDKVDNGRLRALALASVIKGYQPILFEGELIVGNNYGCDKIMKEELTLFDEAMGRTEDEIRAYLQRGQLTKEQIAELLRWHEDKGNTMEARFACTASFDVTAPDEQDVSDELGAFGFCLAYNHTILGYGQVLKHGFAGLEARVRRERAELGALTREQTDFYDACETVLAACRQMGARFAAEARRLAADAVGARRDELRQIAETCERVPDQSARSFREALQSLWFAHIINTWEDGVNANSLGRIDQILYPYYQADIESGALTRDEAFELLCCFYLKLYRDYDVQQSTVGGCDREGRCAANELSYRMLDAIETLDFVRCMSVRLSSDMPRAFMRRALEVVGHVQKGVPFFFADDVLIPALVERGIPIEDARDYAPIGCVEICIPGKANAHAVTGRVNLLKALEYALTGGYSLFDPARRSGLETPVPATYDELLTAVRAQLDRLTDIATAQVNRAIPISAMYDALPYKSILTENCTQTARDFNAGGPVYNYYEIMLLGIPNLADSLESIRKLVFEERRLTLAELTEQLREDFPDETLRLLCVNRAPKYGNDIPEVDAIAADMMDYVCERLSRTPSYWGQGFYAQPFSFKWMLDHGKLCGASPDGRKKGEILAYSVSPMQGRDFSGLTAVLNSLCALPTAKAPATTSAIVEVDPTLFTDRNLDTLAGIVLAAVGKGLCNIQFNTISRETLLDAKAHPEKHRNLAVRVSGFSQKFVLLDEKMQDHIIGRTKHASL